MVLRSWVLFSVIGVRTCSGSRRVRAAKPATRAARPRLAHSPALTEDVMNRSLANATNVVLVLAALTVTGLVVKRELASTARVPVSDPPRAVEGWESLLDEGRLLGPNTAAVTIVAFVDYQCEACGYLHGGLMELRREYPEDFAILYRHYPLPMHGDAIPAALAAECAADQAAYLSYSDALFADQQWIGVRDWTEFARDAGVSNVNAFDRCVENGTFMNNVRRDMAVGRQQGVPGTPTVIIDGMLYMGLSREMLRELVEAALGRA